MPWSTAYRMQFYNVEGANVTVYIYDTTSLVGPPDSYIDLEGSGDPFHLFTVNNDEDLFAPIRALQAEIRFLSTDTTNVSSFFTNDDNRWQVEAYVESVCVFIGFLLLDDVNEDFLDPTTGNEVTLIATDNIGKLKDSPLLDFDGLNPRGYYTLAEYVGMALNATGLSLNINICHNVREENHPTKVMYDSCFLQSKTFERDINESVNAYQVLEMILGEDSFITQYLGEWWIMRLDEIQGVGIRNIFNPAGVYSSSASLDLVSTIGPNESIFFSDRATFVKPKQPVKNLRLTYNYNFPREIVDNIDFSRGTVPTVTGAPYVDTDGLTKVEKRYVLEDWTTKAGSELSPASPTVTAYLRRIFVNEYEKERYAVLPVTASLTPVHWLESNRVPIGNKDKFTFNVDFALESNIGGTGTVEQEVQIMLYGDDGSKWVYGNRPLLGEEYKWALYTGTGTGDLKIRTSYARSTTDEREWQSVSADVRPVPVSGEISIRLLQSGFQNTTVTKFANVQFEYVPFINGSYAKYNGQFHNISQNIRNQVRENEVDISDGPRKLFKGALFVYNGTAYVLAGRFYDGLQFGSTVPADAYLHPFGFNQAFSVWNKNNRSFSQFDIHCQGLNSTVNIPSFMHRIGINEVSPYTTDKKFSLVHFDMDFKLCELKGLLCEVAQTGIPNVYTDTYQFKYVSER